MSSIIDLSIFSTGGANVLSVAKHVVRRSAVQRTAALGESGPTSSMGDKS